METNGSGMTAVIAAFWAALGLAILAGIKAIVSRLWVPRDAVQRKLLEDMKADVKACHDGIATLASHQEAQDTRLRYLENAVLSRDGR